MSILGSVLEIIVGIFKRRQSPQYAKAQRRKMRAQIEREVRSGDVEAMNKRLKKNGIIKALPFILVLSFAGCSSQKVVYINEPECVNKITLNGVDYVLVPSGTYTEMMHHIENCTCQ